MLEQGHVRLPQVQEGVETSPKALRMRQLMWDKTAGSLSCTLPHVRISVDKTSPSELQIQSYQ
eukprot:3236684-Amphidinium_carterae.1